MLTVTEMTNIQVSQWRCGREYTGCSHGAGELMTDVIVRHGGSMHFEGPTLLPTNGVHFVGQCTYLNMR